MGWPPEWLRRGSSPLADPALPMFAPEAVRDFTRMALEVFAEHGVETTYDEGALRGIDGQVFGLANVARRSAGERPARWRQILNAHVAGLLAAQDAPRERDLDKVRDRLFLRLWPAKDVPRAVACRVDLAPGLVGLATIDHPHHVETLTSAADVDDLGGWASVTAVAADNLARLRTRWLMLASPRVSVSVGGFFAASRALVLGRVLTADLLAEAPPYGALFAVPNRNLLAVHVVHDGDVVPAVGTLALLAGREQASAGALSGRVWFWRDGVVEPVGLDGPGPHQRIVPGLGLAAVLDQLGLAAS